MAIRKKQLRSTFTLDLLKSGLMGIILFLREMSHCIYFLTDLLIFFLLLFFVD